jgi:hypothetical protein
MVQAPPSTQDGRLTLARATVDDEAALTRATDRGAIDAGLSAHALTSERRVWEIRAGDDRLGHALLTNINWARRSARCTVVLPGLADLDNPSENLLEAAALGGLAAVNAVLAGISKLAFEEMNLHRIEIQLASTSPLVKLMEPSGFELEGTLRRHVFEQGRYVDVVVYSKLATDAASD